MYSLDAWTGNILWFHETLCRYMVTKKVIESASETDDETEDAPQPEVKKTVNKKEVKFWHLHSLDDLMRFEDCGKWHHLVIITKTNPCFTLDIRTRTPCSQEAKGCRTWSQEAAGYRQLLHQEISTSVILGNNLSRTRSALVLYRGGKETYA